MDECESAEHRIFSAREALSTDVQIAVWLRLQMAQAAKGSGRTHQYFASRRETGLIAVDAHT